MLKEVQIEYAGIPFNSSSASFIGVLRDHIFVIVSVGEGVEKSDGSILICTP